MKKLILISIVSALLVGAITLIRPLNAAPKEHRFLYVASPGIRNYVECGGVGIVVFDIDQGYKWVRRIPTWNLAGEPENVKGIASRSPVSRQEKSNATAAPATASP